MAGHPASVTSRQAQTHSILQRSGILVVSVMVMGIGVTLLLMARLGVVPIDVLHLGVAHAIGYGYGGGVIVVQVALLLIGLPLKVHIGPATVLAFLIPALTADLLLTVLPSPEGIVARIVVFVAGGVLFCVGVAGYLTAKLGQLPRDGLMVVLGRGRPRRTAIVRIMLDLGFVAVGATLLGPAAAVHQGILSVGTVVLALTCGPVIAKLSVTLSRLSAESTESRDAVAKAAP